MPFWVVNRIVLGQRREVKSGDVKSGGSWCVLTARMIKSYGFMWEGISERAEMKVEVWRGVINGFFVDVVEGCSCLGGRSVRPLERIAA